MISMKIINHPSIIHAGPIQIAEGMVPYRIVIRHIPNDIHPEYIIHRENLLATIKEDGLEWSSLDFYWGDYCGSLKEAMSKFTLRNKDALSSGWDI